MTELLGTKLRTMTDRSLEALSREEAMEFLNDNISRLYDRLVDEAVQGFDRYFLTVNEAFYKPHKLYQHLPLTVDGIRVDKVSNKDILVLSW